MANIKIVYACNKMANVGTKSEYEMIIMKITLWVQNGQNGMTDVREPGSGTRKPRIRIWPRLYCSVFGLAVFGTANSYLTEVMPQCFPTGCLWNRESYLTEVIPQCFRTGCLRTVLVLSDRYFLVSYFELAIDYFRFYSCMYFKRTELETY